MEEESKSSLFNKDVSTVSASADTHTHTHTNSRCGLTKITQGVAQRFHSLSPTVHSRWLTMSAQSFPTMHKPGWLTPKQYIQNHKWQGTSLVVVKNLPFHCRGHGFDHTEASTQIGSVLERQQTQSWFSGSPRVAGPHGVERIPSLSIPVTTQL